MRQIINKLIRQNNLHRTEAILFSLLSIVLFFLYYVNAHFEKPYLIVSSIIIVLITAAKFFDNCNTRTEKLKQILSKTDNTLEASEVEIRLNSMLQELQEMSKSLGSLKALQEVDFKEKNTNREEIIGDFYEILNEAMIKLHNDIAISENEIQEIYMNQMKSIIKHLSNKNDINIFQSKIKSFENSLKMIMKR